MNTFCEINLQVEEAVGERAAHDRRLREGHGGVRREAAHGHEHRHEDACAMSITVNSNLNPPWRQPRGK